MHRQSPPYPVVTRQENSELHRISENTEKNIVFKLVLQIYNIKNILGTLLERFVFFKGSLL